MKKAKIRPFATPKPLNRSFQKLACVITSWTALDMQNFVSIGSGVSVPQIRDITSGYVFAANFVVKTVAVAEAEVVAWR